MKKVIFISIQLLILSCLCACDLFDYHPYDVKITGDRDVNRNNCNLIESSCQGKDTLRFAVMGDTQRWYDETQDFVNVINKRSDIDFVIHGGDISDFGVTDEMLLQRDIMNGLNVPYVVLIGNHDCLGTGLEAYKKIFGPLNFSFIAGRIKFVCLNTNAMEYDYSEPVPNLTFIEDESKADSTKFDKTVVCMHSRPYCEQFYNNVAKAFEYYIRMLPGLQFCTVAHDHRLSVEQYFNDGIVYYGSDRISNRDYLLFTITPNGYSYEVVYF
jgi:hypothetical protein